MAQDVILFNPTTRQRIRVYTVDAKELLRGDNKDGWVVWNRDLHSAPEASEPHPVRAPKGAAGPGFGEAAAEFPAAAGPSAGFAPPVEGKLAIGEEF